MQGHQSAKKMTTLVLPSTRLESTSTISPGLASFRIRICLEGAEERTTWTGIGWGPGMAQAVPASNRDKTMAESFIDLEIR